MKLMPKAKGGFSFSQAFAQARKASTSKRQSNKQSTGKTDTSNK